MREIRCQWAKSVGSRFRASLSQAHALSGLRRSRLNLSMAHQTRCSSMRNTRKPNSDRRGEHVARLNGLPLETIDVDVVPARRTDNLNRLS